MKSLFLLLLVSGSALANDTAMLKCRALPDAGARVACYDAIPLGVPAAAAAPAPASQGLFGWTKTREERAPQAIDSTIPGDFEGWGPNTRIKLANGQVWRVIDGGSASLERTRDTKVRIAPNAIGTVFMTIEGTNSSAKVRRVQ